MKKRIASLMLVLIMLLAACAPAADNDPDESKTTADESVDTSQTEETEEKTAYEIEIERRNAISDELPNDEKFDGEKFIIYGGNMLQALNYAEEYTGNIYNDAIYERDLKIESRFDIDFEVIPELVGDAAAIIRNSVQSGLDEYDLAVYQVISMGEDAVNSDLFINWRTVPYVNFDNPWWSDYTTDLLTLFDKTFLAMGSLNMSTLALTKAMVYNLDLADEYNLPNIYDTVLEGRWTLDELERITEGVYIDLNTNGTRDATDRYGLYWSAADTNYYLYALGKISANVTDEGVNADGFYDEKLIAIAEKMYEYVFETPDMFHELTFSAGLGHIKQNTTLLVNDILNNIGTLVESDLNYAIIPLPKWDEAQEKYLTAVDGASDSQGVLKTVQNIELVGLVTEALNAETYKNVEYAYYEKILKGRQLQEKENVQILDIIKDGTVFDFGYIYGGWNYNPGFWLGNTIEVFGANAFASNFTTRTKSWVKYLAKINEYFENYEN